MQTISFLLFRLQESGLGSQDILSEMPWRLKKNKNMLESFLHQGKKPTYVCFCVNHSFQAIWSRKKSDPDTDPQKIWIRNTANHSPVHFS